MDEPIAIIGLDARFPGDADTAENFYDLLLARRSARTEVPSDRWNVDGFWHPDPERGGSTRVRHGHFLKDGVAAFDAPFFSITPAEAKAMDPQQRVLLESVYRALENAGLPVEKVAGSRTGVYVGCFAWDYSEITSKDFEIPLRYAGSGTIASLLSNRVSWFYDFQGPSMTIDTACSSSLVAAHEACMSLKLGDTSMAIVCGCNLMLTPELTLKLDAVGVLSPDGTSYSFDQKANGYSRGEGFGAVVLKRLSDAIRDGDVIRAVIRNSGSNQDGHSPGLTQPTKKAQADLIRDVYSRAALDPALTRFFEAHGTGTPVGDPIEASAIAEIFSSHRSPEHPLYVGALKSNVGHMEGAAGIASIIKGVFTLERGIIPPNAWFESPHPGISDSWNLKFPTEAVEWPQPGLRRMSINSFGVGGSNAHIVLDDAYHFLKRFHGIGRHRTIPTPRLHTSHKESNDLPSTPPNGSVEEHRSSPSLDSAVGGLDVEGMSAGEPQLYVFSSSDKEGVSRLFGAYKDHLTDMSQKLLSNSGELKFLSDLSYTLASKRSMHRWRSFIVSNTLETLGKSLGDSPCLLKPVSKRHLAFVFTGQGAQWPAMGRELMRYSAFEQSILAADKYLGDIGCLWSLTYEMLKDDKSSRLDDPEFCQPICTALQVALVDLLTSWDIQCQTVVGHSSGEIAAAYAAGIISRAAAWKISYYRGKLCGKLVRSPTQAKSGMVAVGLDQETTTQKLEEVNHIAVEGNLQIACINSQQSQTVSGPIEKVDALVDLLARDKIFARKLQVDIGYHSRFMDPIAEEYVSAIGDIEENTRSNTVVFFSSTLGRQASPSEVRNGSYWAQNLTSPVRFHEAVLEMLQEHPQKGSTGSVTHLLEIGPHSALKGPLRNITDQCQLSAMVAYCSVLRRNQPANMTALEVAGTLFCHGYEVDLNAVNRVGDFGIHKPLLLTDLPSYPFNHTNEYWAESRLSKNWKFRSYGRHELLGAPVPDWNKENAIWRNWIRISELPWVEDHKISGDILYPGAGMLLMAIEAIRQVTETSKPLRGFAFQDVSFHQALRIPIDSPGVESHFYLRPVRDSNSSTASTWNEFQLFTLDGDAWREHCRGQVRVEYQTEPNPVDAGLEEKLSSSKYVEDLRRITGLCVNKVPVKKIYRTFDDHGLEYGEFFQTLKDLHLGPSLEALGSVHSPGNSLKTAQDQFLHPTIVDGFFQSGIASLAMATKRSQEALVPIFASEIWFSAAHVPKASYQVSSESQFIGRQEASCSLSAFDSDSGARILSCSGLIFKAIPSNSAQNGSIGPKHLAYNVEWKPDPTFLTPQEASEVFVSTHTFEDDRIRIKKDLQTLTYLYIRRYLELASPSPAIDQHLKRYISWMEHVKECPPKNLTGNDLEELEKRVAAGNSPEGRLTTAVGRALPEILSGQLDALEVLFRDKLAEDIYRNGLVIEPCHEHLCSYVDALAHKNPNMRILEIGAGTGGTTKPILETLMRNGKRWGHYTFTDISPSFFESARDIFQDHVSQMSFQVLNVENSPVDQGFIAGDYDLVIAANVLHATKNIESTLSNARTLLKPGGKLLVLEITDPNALYLCFCFGLLPGWWLSEEADRKWSPLLSVEGWEHHLSRSGYSGLDAVFHDIGSPEEQTSSILVSSTDTSSVNKPPDTTQITVLTNGVSQLQNSLAQRLLARFHQPGACKTVSILEAGESDLKESTCVVLAELEAPILRKVHDDMFGKLKQIVKECKSVLWVNHGGTAEATNPDMELITGLARTIRSENTMLKFVTTTFTKNQEIDTMVESISRILSQAQFEPENTFRVHNGVLRIPRLVEAGYLTDHIQALTSPQEAIQAKLEPEDRMVLQIGTIGLLDTLKFENDPKVSEELGESEVEFRVISWGINFHDLAEALGKVRGESFGLEASGIVTRVSPGSRFQVGDHVFGLCFNGAMKTHARSYEGFLAKKPDTLSWTEAASIPVVYSTAYAALFETGTTKKGDTILVHSAAGGLGQAVIQLAQLHGATVLATVGSTEKRDFLEKTYGIPREHIFSSRDLSFRSGIKRVTNSRGVDLALNSLAGDALRATWDCVAPFGRFVEFGLVDIHANARIPMGNFHRNTRFEALDMIFLARHDPQRCESVFQRMVDLVIHGSGKETRKTPVTVFPISEAQAAFRFMQSGKHIGKIVLEYHDDDLVPILPSPRPVGQFRQDASYLIVGGLGGLGRSVARWMASRGARNLILLSRRGAVDDSALRLVKELQNICDQVATPSCDVADVEALRKVVAECTKDMPPIKGCIQGSMVLRDNRFVHMEADEWNETIRSKVNTSWNLQDVLGNDIDFFVMLSSAMGTIGNVEQCNYAAGSTYQDALARWLRETRSMNAVSLDLPVVLDVGFVAEKPELEESMLAEGNAFMTEDEVHAALDYHCRPLAEEVPLRRASVLPSFWLPQYSAAEGVQLPAWRNDPIFNHLIQAGGSGTGVAVTKVVKHAALLAAAPSLKDAENIGLDAFLAKLSRVLSVDVTSLDVTKPLHAHGVDSLVTVELRSWCAKELGADMSVFEMTNAPSIAQLAEAAVSRSRFIPSFA